MRRLPYGMKEKILSAAELFAEQGLIGTTMEDIAAATGVPKATLYYYFDAKEDILALLFIHILDELGRAVEGALQTGGSAADRLRAIVIAHLGVIEAFPAASRALQSDVGRSARGPTIAQRTNAAFVEPVEALLIEGGRDGSLRAAVDARVVATAILGAVTTSGLDAVRPATARSIRRVEEDLTAFVLRGVAS